MASNNPTIIVMAATKSTPAASLVSQAAFMLVIITALAALPPPAAAESCSASLSKLSVCAPFVVPGVGGTAQSPNANCCAALRGVDGGCACSTLNIISKLPTSCGLPPVSCNGA